MRTAPADVILTMIFFLSDAFQIVIVIQGLRFTSKYLGQRVNATYVSGSFAFKDYI